MEIEFRAQANNGEWAYGDLINNKYIFTGYHKDGQLLLCEIGPTTLAIHFPFYNIKSLYFGLNNYEGASVIEAKFKNDQTPFKGIAMCDSNGHVFYDKNDDWVNISELTDIQVTGI